MASDLIYREDAKVFVRHACYKKINPIDYLDEVPAADVRPVSEIEKIIESLQEQADIYNARAKELLVEEDGQVSQYTWAVSLRETYRRIIKTLDDLIS